MVGESALEALASSSSSSTILLASSTMDKAMSMETDNPLNFEKKSSAIDSDERKFVASNPTTPMSTTNMEGDESTSRDSGRVPLERNTSRAPKRSASVVEGSSRQLPKFTSNLIYTVQHAPAPRASNAAEFTAPSPQLRKQSRPNSPSAAGRAVPVPPRGRIASIRRESDCSLESEVAHERLMKTAQQVSVGFEEFSLDEKTSEERKRAKSLTEPISIFTNAFLPQSSSPSPTRNVDTQKQCYSPSTQQVVRNNIPYSPSPSPTPSSPTRHRIMRHCLCGKILSIILIL
jgi:hypothetical protein